ncbi:MAG: Coenzyme F420 hydrogenase/dehydrogenase, beta subunit C-terminal domain, partial [Bacteroidaceae bacterium]|nr:Coenzyme F420 hydrogenase/dehydrogenase, beta subunit C-terminal domain [Bacteroidaceae bacterium]
MIQILDKKACCGCNACVQICPQQCIEMTADEQGFLYPKVQQEACIHCGLCEAVCPIIHPKPSRTPLGVYASKCKKERIRLQSSSGGIFTLLAEKTIQDGGVVFGVRFNQQWEAVHDYTETIEGLAAFRGSKYVQSRVGNSFQQARSFLTEGRQVLFSGTPCQIAGLKNFLRKAYSNLCTVDIVCRGLLSPMIWKMYLTKITATEEKKMAAITHITFRDKSMGWRNYHL